MGSLDIWLKHPDNEDILALWNVFLGDAKTKDQVFYKWWSLLL